MTTFNPFAIERPKINLGELGEFELGEIHESRHAKLVGLFDKFGKLTQNEDSSLSDVAIVVGEMLEAVCISANELGAKFAALADVKVHGEKAIGLQTLRPIVEFMGNYLSGELAVGED